MLGCHPSTLTQRSIHHQKSSSDSPFQANTEKPVGEHIRRSSRETRRWKESMGKRKRRKEIYLPQPGRLLLHFGWSRCYTRPTCTERQELRGSPSTPTNTQTKCKYVQMSKIQHTLVRIFRFGLGGDARRWSYKTRAAHPRFNLWIFIEKWQKVITRVGLFTHSSLSSDVGASHNFGSSQWLFSLSSLPQRHEGRHLCGAQTNIKIIKWF